MSETHTPAETDTFDPWYRCYVRAHNGTVSGVSIDYTSWLRAERVAYFAEDPKRKVCMNAQHPQIRQCGCTLAAEVARCPWESGRRSEQFTQWLLNKYPTFKEA